MKKKTKKNPRGSGREPKFKPEYGKTKRLPFSFPEKKEQEVREKYAEIIKPYLNDKTK